MILSFVIIIIPDMFDPDKHTIDGTIEIHTWQYHIAAIGIFITWLINMLMVSSGGLGIWKYLFLYMKCELFSIILGREDSTVWHICPNA